MEAERWQQIERIYHAVLGLPASQRRDFLEQACAGDEALKQELASLIAESHGADDPLEAAVIEMAAEALANPVVEETEASAVSLTRAKTSSAHPAVIGRYRIIRLLGEGGMGVVYEAEQEQPRRVVALKVIKSGFCTPEVLWRFEHEAQALGRLQHPGIAQIYEAGMAETAFGTQPYFAMELIRGEALLAYVEAHQLNMRQRLALMARVCEAVQHAHQRGLIHRDLKPGNILVDETGQPKILDFGVARMTEAEGDVTRQTSTGEIVGTLSYMSPEQVTADPLGLDIRSDVYSLGVILYELLSGRLPYSVNQRQLPEAVRTIREDDPTSLSSINRTYRGDIETIVGKALEKDKARRYASAADLAADIQRYLSDEPITARPPSTTYQLRKFARRHRIAVAVASGLVVLLIAFAVVQAVELRRIAAERDRANRAAAVSKAVSDFLQYDLLAQASTSYQSGLSTRPDPDLKVRTALDRAAQRITGKFDKQLEVEAAIRQRIGQAYAELGLYAEAQKQLERGLDLFRQVLGAENPETLETMSSLGTLAWHRGKYAEAEKLLSQAAEARRRVLGNASPETLRSEGDLALVYHFEGKYAQAEALQVQTLEIKRRVLGPESTQTLWSMNNLATLYQEEGKYAQAEALQGQTLEIKRRVLGPEHPDTLRSMSNLATSYESEGKHAQAEALDAQILEVRLRVLGPEHPDTDQSRINLADVYNAEHKYAQAEALFRQALEISQRVLGPEHGDTLAAMINLAEVSGEQGNYIETEKLDKTAVETSRKALGPEHLYTLIAMSDLAGAYGAQHKFAQAEALFRQTLEIKERVLGPAHPSTLDTVADFASMYLRQREYARAEMYAARALAGRRRALGSEHPDTMASAADLATAYVWQGRFGESEPLAREALAFNQKKQPDDWQRFRAETLLGASLAGQKKYAEAEPLLAAGYRGMLAQKERIAVADRYHLDRAHEWLVKVDQVSGKPAKAAE